MNDGTSQTTVRVPMWTYPCPAVLMEIPLQGHVRIEASAGTGKTYTLEHLVVDRLIRTEAALPQILVMTFTEKATSELKQRIRKLLTSVILKAKPAAESQTSRHDTADIKLDEEGDTHWYFGDLIRRKLELTLFGFDEAPIYTIHGFCNRILREQAFYLGEPLLQERVDSKILFREVWRDFLASPSAQLCQVVNVLSSWLEKKEEASLFQLLYDAYNGKYLRFGFQPYPHIEVCRKVLSNESLQKQFIDDVENAAVRAKARDALKVELKSLVRLLSSTPDHHEFNAKLSQVSWADLLKPHGQAKKEGQLKYPLELSPSAKAFYESMADLFHLHQMLSAEDYQAIQVLLPPLTDSMLQRKRRDFQFDYDDLLFRLHQTLVIEGNEQLAEQLRDQYQFALIDEFQDTDQIQWQITERIFLGAKGAQLVLIGDPKQAIYRFRGAEIETYLDAGSRLEATVGIRPTDVFLDTNYRSSQALLAGINLIFLQSDQNPLFSGKIGYSNPVKCGRPDLRLEAADGRVEAPISLMRYQPTGKISVTRMREHYVSELTAQILQLLTPPLMQIRLDSDTAVPLAPAHIMVLVRTNAEAKVIEAALRGANLPVAQAPSGSVFESDEAYEVLDLLRAVQSPLSTNAWTRVMTGPFFARDHDEASDAEKVRPTALRIRLEKWHGLATTGRVEQVLSEAYEQTSLELRAALFDQEDQRLLNLRAILNCCAVEVQKRRLRLHQLIEWVEAVVAGLESPPEPFGEAPPAPENSNSIRIMTFHKSKGLESPVVFVCGGFGAMRKQLIHRSSVYGEKQIFLGNYLPKAVERDVARAAHEEDERLLYVALTRASVKLYLPYIAGDARLKGMYDILNQRLSELEQSHRLPAAQFLRDSTCQKSHAPTPAAPPAVAMPAAETIAKALLPITVQWSEAETPIASYSSLKRHQNERLQRTSVIHSSATQLDPEVVTDTEPEQVSENLISANLSGGKFMGQVLHDCLEMLDITPFFNRGLKAFMADSTVQNIAHEAVSKHHVDAQEIPAILALTWHVLTKRFQLTQDLILPPLGNLKLRKEMEFLYPYPAGSTQDKGYIRGFIDALFVHDGKYYWLDWKSDRLSDYGRSAIAAHVEAHYGIQAQLYTLALSRLLRITDKTDYDEKIGGLIYVYLRGIDSESETSEQGIFFMRQTYEMVTAFQQTWSENGLYEPPDFQLDTEVGKHGG